VDPTTIESPTVVNEVIGENGIVKHNSVVGTDWRSLTASNITVDRDANAKFPFQKTRAVRGEYLLPTVIISDNTPSVKSRERMEVPPLNQTRPFTSSHAIAVTGVVNPTFVAFPAK
jgi:hypothetical protein